MSVTDGPEVATERSKDERGPDPSEREPEGDNPGMDWVDLGQRYGVIVAWVLVIVVFSLLRPERFPTAGNLQTILASQSVLVILTLGLTMSLAAGEFDLSVGAVLGFASIMVAFLNGIHDWPVWLAVGSVLMMAAGFGVVNAFLSVTVGIPSIITTLGMGTLIIGLGLGISGSQIISGVDSGFVSFMTDRLLWGLPITFFFGIGLALVVWFVYQHTPLGRYLVFIAEGREVARLAGIRVQAIRFGSLVATSFFAGVAGVALVGTLGAADPSAGNSYLLPTFAAAFLGSTTVVPGRFNAFGTLVAVYFLVTGITGLQLMGFAGWIEQVFYGGSLVLAVTFGQLAGRGRVQVSG